MFPVPRFINLPNIAIFIIIAYLSYDRLFQKSESQRLLSEAESKALKAEELSNLAIQRTETIQVILGQISSTIKDLNNLNEVTILYVKETDKKYNMQKDSIYKSFNNRLNNVKQQLTELKKLQDKL